MPTPSPSTDAQDFALPDLSDTALTFLSSAYYQESASRLKESFALSNDDLSFLNEMDHMVLGGALTLDGYVRALQGEFPQWDDATRTKCIGQLLATRFVPWGDRLHPSAKAVSQATGIPLPPTPYYVVYDAPLDPLAAAREIFKMTGIPANGGLEGRLAALLKSRSTGVRVAEQAEAQLMRSLDQGGLGLEPEQAHAMTLAMDDVLRRVRIGPATAEAPAPTAGPAPARPLSPADVAPTPEEEKEVAAVRRQMPVVARGDDAMAQSVANVRKQVTLVLEDDYLNRRLEQIISTRLREVRSRNDVLVTLMRGVKVGGMGLDRAVAEKTAEEIEQGYAVWHETRAAEQTIALEEETRQQEVKAEVKKQQEVEAHDAWFATKTAKAKKPTPPTPAATPAITSVPPGTHPVDAKEQVREKEAFGDLVIVPPPAPSPLAPPPITIPAPAKAAPTPPAPAAKPSVKISAASATAARASTPTRPRMADVVPVEGAPRLVGPLQELERLSLDAFRRLNKDPRQAAEHVRQLVRLLAEQGFTPRIKGIQAWADSPLQRLYVSLVADAFSSGTPIKQLLAKKRAEGAPALTDEELDVIVALNGELQL